MRHLGLVALLLPLAAHAAVPVQVTGADFYVEVIGLDGSVERRETTRVPYLPEQACYSWVLRVAPTRAERRVQERLVLPAPASEWGLDAGEANATRVAPDRDSALTDLTLAGGADEVSSGWCVAPDDPQGRYRIEVSAGGKLLHRFDFIVGSDTSI